MSEPQYKFDPDIIKEFFFAHAEKKEAAKELEEIKKMIEAKLTKAVLVSSVEMIFEGIGVSLDSDRAAAFAERFVDRCEERNIPVIDGTQFFVEELCDFGNLIGGITNE